MSLSGKIKGKQIEVESIGMTPNLSPLSLSTYTVSLASFSFSERQLTNKLYVDENLELKLDKSLTQSYVFVGNTENEAVAVETDKLYQDSLANILLTDEYLWSNYATYSLGQKVESTQQVAEKTQQGWLISKKDENKDLIFDIDISSASYFSTASNILDISDFVGVDVLNIVGSTSSLSATVSEIRGLPLGNRVKFTAETDRNVLFEHVDRGTSSVDIIALTDGQSRTIVGGTYSEEFIITKINNKNIEVDWDIDRLYQQINSNVVNNINDLITATDSLWSSQKVSDELDLKIDDSQLNDSATGSATQSFWSANKLTTEFDLKLDSALTQSYIFVGGTSNIAEPTQTDKLYEDSLGDVLLTEAYLFSNYVTASLGQKIESTQQVAEKTQQGWLISKKDSTKDTIFDLDISSASIFSTSSNTLDITNYRGADVLNIIGSTAISSITVSSIVGLLNDYSVKFIVDTGYTVEFDHTDLGTTSINTIALTDGQSRTFVGGTYSEEFSIKKVNNKNIEYEWDIDRLYQQINSNVENNINDLITATNSLWSSQKVSDELDLKIDDSQLNDSATSSTSSFWSANKLTTEFDLKIDDTQLDDSATGSATQSFWSANKLTTEFDLKLNDSLTESHIFIGTASNAVSSIPTNNLYEDSLGRLVLTDNYLNLNYSSLEIGQRVESVFQVAEKTQQGWLISKKEENRDLVFNIDVSSASIFLTASNTLVLDNYNTADTLRIVGSTASLSTTISSISGMSLDTVITFITEDNRTVLFEHTTVASASNGLLVLVDGADKSIVGGTYSDEISFKNNKNVYFEVDVSDSSFLPKTLNTGNIFVGNENNIATNIPSEPLYQDSLGDIILTQTYLASNYITASVGQKVESAKQVAEKTQQGWSIRKKEDNVDLIYNLDISSASIFLTASNTLVIEDYNTADVLRIVGSTTSLSSTVSFIDGLELDSSITFIAEDERTVLFEHTTVASASSGAMILLEEVDKTIIGGTFSEELTFRNKKDLYFEVEASDDTFLTKTLLDGNILVGNTANRAISVPTQKLYEGSEGNILLTESYLLTNYATVSLGQKVESAQQVAEKTQQGWMISKKEESRPLEVDLDISDTAIYSTVSQAINLTEYNGADVFNIISNTFSFDVTISSVIGLLDGREAKFILSDDAREATFLHTTVASASSNDIILTEGVDRTITGGTFSDELIIRNFGGFNKEVEWSIDRIYGALGGSGTESNINDGITSTFSTWSSTKIQTELDSISASTALINDAITATDSTWSSSKIDTELDLKVDDTQISQSGATGSTDVWSGAYLDLVVDSFSTQLDAKLDDSQLNDSGSSTNVIWSANKIQLELDGKNIDGNPNEITFYGATGITSSSNLSFNDGITLTASGTTGSTQPLDINNSLGDKIITIRDDSFVGINTATQSDIEKLRVYGAVNITHDTSHVINGNITQTVIDNINGQRLLEIDSGANFKLNDFNNGAGSYATVQDLTSNFNEYFLYSGNAAVGRKLYMHMKNGGFNSGPKNLVSFGQESNDSTTQMQIHFERDGTLLAASPTVFEIVDSFGTYSIDLAGATATKTGFKSLLSDQFETTTTGMGIVRSAWFGATGGDINQALYIEDGYLVSDSGQITFNNLPATSSGIDANQVWFDGAYLRIGTSSGIIGGGGGGGGGGSSINDAITATDSTWSSSKIDTELDTKMPDALTESHLFVGNTANRAVAVESFKLYEASLTDDIVLNDNYLIDNYATISLGQKIESTEFVSEKTQQDWLTSKKNPGKEVVIDLDIASASIFASNNLEVRDYINADVLRIVNTTPFTATVSSISGLSNNFKVSFIVEDGGTVIFEHNDFGGASTNQMVNLNTSNYTITGGTNSSRITYLKRDSLNYQIQDNIYGVRDVTDVSYTIVLNNFNNNEYFGITGSTTTVTIPDSVNDGKYVIIKDEAGDAGGSTITINGTIDNGSSTTITTNYGVVRLLWNNESWWTV